MGIVLTSSARALPALPLRLRRDTIPPHDPSGPFADHPCVGFTRLPGNDSAIEQRKSSVCYIGRRSTAGTGLTVATPVPAVPSIRFSCRKWLNVRISYGNWLATAYVTGCCDAMEPGRQPALPAAVARMGRPVAPSGLCRTGLAAGGGLGGPSQKFP